MVGPQLLTGTGPQRRRDLAGGPDGRAGLGHLGAPAVLGVGHDDRAVGELDLEAGPAGHDLGGRHHRRRSPVGPDQLVADSDLGHRRPARRRDQSRVERERLADRRPRGQHDHLARVQPVGQLVEVGEPGGHPDHLAAAGADRLDLVERALHDRRQRQVVLGGTPVGDVVDLDLGGVDDVVGVAVTGVAELDDLGAGLDQPPQDRRLAHDPRVVARVRRGGHRLQQRVDVRRAADPAQLATLLQLGRDRHRIGRLATAVEVEHGLVDQLVRRPVEVVPADDLDDVGDGVLGQQHAAQDGLLGREVLRWGAAQLAGRRHARELRDAHSRTPLSTAPWTCIVVVIRT